MVLLPPISPRTASLFPDASLFRSGYAAAHRSSAAESIPDWARWRDQALGVTFEPAVIVYNRDLVPPEHVPDTRFDLLRLMREHADTYRSEEHTSELQSIMRISYAVFCMQKKNPRDQKNTTPQ